jgi:hypothetical protein
MWPSWQKVTKRLRRFRSLHKSCNLEAANLKIEIGIPIVASLDTFNFLLDSISGTAHKICRSSYQSKTHIYSASAHFPCISINVDLMFIAHLPSTTVTSHKMMWFNPHRLMAVFNLTFALSKMLRSTDQSWQ